MRGSELVVRLQEFQSCYRGFDSRLPYKYFAR
jgi:hypothetical protein